jgi:general stress protein YciG
VALEEQEQQQQQKPPEEEEREQEQEQQEQQQHQKKKKRRRKYQKNPKNHKNLIGLAKASKRTRLKVARAGGNAYHSLPRGLGSLHDSDKVRIIATAGGKARAKDKEGLSTAGRKGGEKVKELYGGVTYFAEIGSKGGTTTSTNREFMAEIGRKGGSKVVQVYGYEFLTEIARNRKKKKKKKKL